MNYEETLNYIHKVSMLGSRPGLDRIRKLLSLLGDPQNKLRFIHVAGTNGKGSFCAMCDSVLRTAGYHTGLYTSPYIVRFNERIAIDGKPISDKELAEVTTYVRTFADTMTEDPPTEFELITAVAMVVFERRKCDPIVLEVGMGGRFDATNVIKTPIISVITGISLDHTAILGDTVSAIAGEKAGIIKDGVPVIFGGVDADADAVIKAVAEKHVSEYIKTKQETVELISADLDGTEFIYDGEKYAVSLLGLYQPHNAANVVEAVKLLNRKGLRISNAELMSGLKNAVWKGRFERLSKEPLFIIDGSHNPEGVAAAVSSIKAYFGNKKVCLISGVMKDKDHAGMARELSQIAAYAYTLRPSNPRALDPGIYAEEFRKHGVISEGFEIAQHAVDKAVETAKKEDLPIVALGSLYMYGDVFKCYIG